MHQHGWAVEEEPNSGLSVQLLFYPTQVCLKEMFISLSAHRPGRNKAGQCDSECWGAWQMVNHLTGSLQTECMFSWMAGCCFCSLFFWLGSWLVCCLADWLPGWLAHLLFPRATEHTRRRRDTITHTFNLLSPFLRSVCTSAPQGGVINEHPRVAHSLLRNTHFNTNVRAFPAPVFSHGQHLKKYLFSLLLLLLGLHRMSFSLHNQSLQ